MEQMLIRVDRENRELGPVSWKDAHAWPGILHRAFSVYVFRKDGTEFLLQRRSSKKPLWGRILANSCCSHPRVGEETLQAAHRRLREELGFNCALRPVGDFIYRADDPAGKGSEHEHVTLIRGDVDTDIVMTVNPEEAEEAKWITVTQLHQEMVTHPDHYAPWFHTGLPMVLSEK